MPIAPSERTVGCIPAGSTVRASPGCCWTPSSMPAVSEAQLDLLQGSGGDPHHPQCTMDWDGCWGRPEQGCGEDGVPGTHLVVRAAPSSHVRLAHHTAPDYSTRKMIYGNT
jgi:hypothetical protein